MPICMHAFMLAYQVKLIIGLVTVFKYLKFKKIYTYKYNV